MTRAVAPIVRVVVVNFNAGERILRCLRHLVDTEWPRDRLRICVVDNASDDGSVELIAAAHPDVEIVRSPANLGFAGGSNLGMRDRHDVAYIALVNNDAFVEPNWLRPLVDALEDDPLLGAACPRIVFEPRFVELAIATEGFVPGPHDTRDLGVRVGGVRVEGLDRWRYFHVVEGGYGEEVGEDGARFRWLGPRSVVWVAVTDDAPTRVQMRLAAETNKRVRFSSGAATTELDVGPDFAWYDVALSGETFDVVQNAGSVLTTTGAGADRGFWTKNGPDFDKSVDVFGWCGAAVVLRRDYLDDVGIFDDTYFMYYEDLDLSWRGRLRGWRYAYVPDSIVRHLHAESSREGSAMFEHYVSRNRLLTLVKNAPTEFAARQVVAYLREMLTIARYELVVPLRRRRSPSPVHTKRRIRSLLAFVKLLRHATESRRAIERRRVLKRVEPLGYAVEW